jgi:hypothetical protein
MPRGFVVVGAVAAAVAGHAAPAAANSGDFAVAVDGPAKARVGGQAAYKITVTNAGPQNAAAVLRFTRGRGATSPDDGSSLHTVSEQSSQGDCNNDGKGVICRLGAIASGEAATATIGLEIFDRDRPKLPLQATVGPDAASGDLDPSHANNHVELVTKILDPILLSGLPKGCLSRPANLTVETQVGSAARTKVLVDNKVIESSQHAKLTAKLDPKGLDDGKHRLSIVVQAHKGPPVAALKRKFKSC